LNGLSRAFEGPSSAVKFVATGIASGTQIYTHITFEWLFKSDLPKLIPIQNIDERNLSVKPFA